MMLIRWQTTRYHPTKIDRIECDRETTHSIWINGRRRARHTEYHNLFSTWEDARSHLQLEQELAIASYERLLHESKRSLSQINALTKPGNE